MALSGLDIYKHLPKTNCRECGFPTCLAFAMQLAKRLTNLDKCPYVSEEAKKLLDSASQPPIKLVTIGSQENLVEVGNETVMFRHEEKFFHPTGIGFLIEDNLSEGELVKTINNINKLSFERVGQIIKVNLIALKQTKDTSNFLNCLKKTMDLTNLSLILISSDEACLKGALEITGKRRPLVYAATQDNLEKIALLAKEYCVPLAMVAKDLSGLANLTPRLNNLAVNELILDTQNKNLTKRIDEFTQVRRLALKKTFRALGYPVMVVIENDDIFQEASLAASYICKYANIVILKSIEPEVVLPLLTLRQNIYTDPQKPLQVEPKIYAIGQVNKNSPILVTTNFSLTYYTVLSEVESSKIPSYILSVDTEGMSVLTAWAAEKFTPEKITESFEKNNIKSLVSHQKLIIPGYVAIMKADLEDKTNWEILVGPREAAGIPSFLKSI